MGNVWWKIVIMVGKIVSFYLGFLMCFCLLILKC